MNITTLTSLRLVVGVIALALLAVAAVAAPTKPAAPAFPEAHDTLRGYVNDIRTGEAVQVGRLTLVPLRHDEGGHLRYVQGHPSLLDATLQRVEGEAVILRLRNDTTRAILATAGRVTYVDGAEFVLAHDVLVPGEGQRDVEAWPVGRIQEDALERGTALRWYPRWAPTPLSKKLVLRDDPAALQRLVAAAPTNEACARECSLRDILSSQAGRSLDPKLAKVLHAEAFRGPNVVGFVLGIDGRIVGLHLFGSASLHRAKAAGLLGSFGLYSHALDARADELRVRSKDGAEAREAVTVAAHDLLRTLQAKARFTHGEDRTFTVRGPGITGFGSVHGGAPLHLTLKPGDPARTLLFETSGA